MRRARSFPPNVRAFAQKPTKARAARPADRDRVFFAAFIVAAAFLAFVAGAYAVLDKAGPYRILKSAYDAGYALYGQLTHYADPLQTDLWQPARGPERGVLVHDRRRAYQGLTLYTSGHDTAARLIDMEGRVVHEWHLEFSQIWDETSVVEEPRPDPFVYFRDVHFFPNGDLLAVVEGTGDTPWGLALVKLDRSSRVIWKYLGDRAHHDVEVGEDGRVYTLTHEIRHRPMDGYDHLEPPLIEDFLLVLSPDGKVERRISLLEALARSPYAQFLYAVPTFAHSDPLHTNAVEPIGREAAGRFPFGGARDVILSFRQIGLIAVIALDRQEITWGMWGPWVMQHDPDLLPDGNVLLFDNHGSFTPGGMSRVLEVDPATMRIVWSYGGTADRPLSSILRSDQQRLPNGNTLVTESDGGRILEVTRAGEVVWEFVNPVRGGVRGEKIAIIATSQRVPPLDLSFRAGGNAAAAATGTD